MAEKGAGRVAPAARPRRVKALHRPADPMGSSHASTHRRIRSDVSAAIDFTYRYPFPSSVERDAKGANLRLATCSGAATHPHFFDGALRDPRIVGDMLLVLSDVVRTHFFMPRSPASLDPVLTSSDSMLRLEGFSGCCGVYARVDLPAEAFDRELQGKGTTNVDFNDPMRAALTRIRRDEQVRLAVGRDGVELTRAGETTVEKKVKLPVRWIKGFSEVQAYQPSLAERHELPAADALRLLRELPRSSAPKRPSFLVPGGRSLRWSQRDRPGAVRVSGMHRLRVLEPLVTRARAVRVWYDEGAGTSAWEVLFERGRFFHMISPELFRGFSGEGQVLDTLARDEWRALLPRVRAQLAWQAELDAGALASEVGADAAGVEAALAALGARGLAGYDAAAGAYFHRELPFDLSAVEQLQPRLRGARKLLTEDKAKLLEKTGDDACDVAVAGTDVTHHVRLRPEGDRCSCPWFSRHRGERGPCKHVLAARLLVEEQALRAAESKSA
jgi:hypothetical protein